MRKGDEMKTQDYLVLGLFDGLMQAKKEQEENEKMNDQNIFTEDEKTILRSLLENFKWIARDKDGFIYVYANKPQRGELVFKCQDGYKLTSYHNINIFKHIFKGVTWKNSPICFRKPILDDVERRYLKNVFRPFKDKEIFVRKVLNRNRKEAYLIVAIRGDDVYDFPPFDFGTMYKGMELDKEYTLEELGITYEQ